MPAERFEDLLDRVERLHAAGVYEPVRETLQAEKEELASGLRMLLEDRQMRPEHRARVYADLASQRALLLEKRDARILDLIFWSEHVETLFGSLKRGRASTFHFTRALEATCRRCGFDLLPVMGRIEQLGQAWAGRDYAATYAMLIGQPTS